MSKAKLAFMQFIRLYLWVVIVWAAWDLYKEHGFWNNALPIFSIVVCAWGIKLYSRLIEREQREVRLRG